MKVRDHHLRLMLTAVLPVGILAAVLVWYVVDSERRTLQASLGDVARAISHSLDSEIRRTITALDVLALSPNVGEASVDVFRREAASVQERHGGWSNVLLFRADGQTLMNLQAVPGSALPRVRNPAVIEQTIAQRKPQVSNATTSAVTGRPVVFVSVPVFRDGAVAYSLQATMEYPVWTDWLKRQLPAGWIAAIDDRNGRIFARSERPEAFVGKDASATFRRLYAEQSTGISRSRNIEGVEIIAAFHTSELTGWHVLVLTPASLLTQHSNRFAASVVGSYVVILVLGLVAALWMAQPLARGIGRLRDAIGRLGRGESTGFEPTGISEIDEAGESIRRAGELLAERDARVGELKSALAERAEVAERANRMKDQFLGMLGHEIRNPLAAIANAATVLLMRSQGSEREMHEMIRRQTRHLALLVDDLLDVSRLAQGKLRIERQPLDLASIVQRVRDAIESEGLAEDRVVRWSLQPAHVQADAVRMTQVVRNLVDNALRYTPAGGRIDVVLEAHGDRAILKVSDEGVGIAGELLTQIFEPFVQAPQNLDRRTGGLGLGLAIVKQVVALHEGTIRADSDGPGRGATFTVDLPVAAPSAPALPAVSSTPWAVRHRRIAIVEDHVDARRSLRLLLEGLGCEVLEAGDGEEGLAMLANGQFDAAFIDLGLPGIDGFELATRLRRSGSTLRLIAVSGYGQDTDRTRARAAQFDEFIVKPLTEDQLASALGATGRAATVE